VRACGWKSARTLAGLYVEREEAADSVALWTVYAEGSRSFDSTRSLKAKADADALLALAAPGGAELEVAKRNAEVSLAALRKDMGLNESMKTAASQRLRETERRIDLLEAHLPARVVLAARALMFAARWDRHALVVFCSYWAAWALWCFLN